ncbi:MAG: efflux RND transporter permease subunit [Tidjanibacter sp.]|nr:efflux RND transporter permease subunit [Tidjanibacter sp.]
MTNNLSGWALHNKKLIYFLIAVTILFGLYSAYDISKLEDPRISIKMALVVAVYPGASAYDVELNVVDPLEKSIRSIKNIDDIQSTCTNDMAIIQVSFDWSLPPEQTEQYFDILRRKVNDIQSSMPEGVQLRVSDDFGDVYGMFYTLESEGFTNREMTEYAEKIKHEVQMIKGVSDVKIFGGEKESIDIVVNQDRMASLGVLPAEVLMTLGNQTKNVYSGYFDAGDRRIRIAVDDRLDSAEQIGNMIISGHESDLLRLRDIATVENGTASPSRSLMYRNGNPAIGISISAEEGTDVVKLGHKVDRRIEELRSNMLPAGISVDKVFFQPERVSKALGVFATNLIESVLIVILSLMLTMGYRNGLIIGKTLIITVLGSLAVLYIFGGTLQRVSLGAFILAMGMLVDNAIVIADGIAVDLQRGVPREEALTSIGRKTAWPLLAATLIAIIAFLPPFLSKDSVGEYLHDLFIVLAVSLLLSWVLALVYVPIEADKRIKIKPEKAGRNPYDSKIYNALRRTMEWSLTHRTIVLGGALVLVLASVWCFRYLPREFFPDMEYEQIFIEYKLPEGTAQRKVKADLDEITAYLNADPNVTGVTMALGGTPSRYNLVRSVATPSLSYGELIVDYLSPDVLVEHLPELQAYLQANYPEAVVRAKRYNLMFKKYPIELQFEGPDPAVLKKLTAEAVDIMERSPYFRRVTTDWEPEVPVLNIDYDQARAREASLSRTDVGMSVLAASEGIPVGNLYDGWYTRPIYLKVADANGKPIESLNTAPVFGTLPPVENIDGNDLKGLLTGTTTKSDLLEKVMSTTPLDAVSNGISLRWDDPIVVRDNGTRAMNALGDVAWGESTESARASVKDEVAKIELPDGYQMRWRGEHEASGRAMESLFKNVPLTIVLIIALLIALLKDYRRPLIIFLCLPLLAVGVVFGIWVSGKAFGFVAICGCLGLMGMLIKNAVILMDEIDAELRNGVEAKTALIESSASRFRPVMMASLTTIFGMIPLLKDCLFGSLSVTIMSGLLVGTLITLLFIPILYSLFFKIKTR